MIQPWLWQVGIVESNSFQGEVDLGRTQGSAYKSHGWISFLVYCKLVGNDLRILQSYKILFHLTQNIGRNQQRLPCISLSIWGTKLTSLDWIRADSVRTFPGFYNPNWKDFSPQLLTLMIDTFEPFGGFFIARSNIFVARLPKPSDSRVQIMRRRLCGWRRPR